MTGKTQLKWQVALKRMTTTMKLKKGGVAMPFQVRTCPLFVLKPVGDLELHKECIIQYTCTFSVWGNQNNMNLNPLVFTNITTSPYFKVTLIQYKVS